MTNVTLIGVLGLVAIAACWTLAVLLYRVGPPDSMARKLALLLVIEGITLGTAGFPEYALGLNNYEFPIWYYVSSFVTHHLGDAFMIILYPAFLAVSLRTRLTQGFARKGVRVALTIVSLLLVPAAVVSYGLFESQAGSGAIYVLLMLTFIFALVASIDAWRTAKHGIARERARAFLIAFGIRDVCWGFVYGASFYMVATQTFSPDNDLFWYVKIVYALGSLFAVPLIAYGILRGHLFDIDLKIRWTIKQSTLAGLIVAIVFLISEGTSMFLEAELGSITGLLAAAVVIFFLTPLQQFAEKIAASAMPDTENTPEYIAFRKMQVYEAALTEALQEGGISAKERSLLVRLRDSLGISETDAEAIETELQSPQVDTAQ